MFRIQSLLTRIEFFSTSFSKLSERRGGYSSSRKMQTVKSSRNYSLAFTWGALLLGERAVRPDHPFFACQDDREMSSLCFLCGYENASLCSRSPRGRRCVCVLYISYISILKMLAAVLTYWYRARGLVTSAVLWCFWLLWLIGSAILAYSEIKNAILVSTFNSLVSYRVL